MIDYSKRMVPATTYDWEIENRKKWKKQREEIEKEEAKLAAVLKQGEEKRTEEFVKQFSHHPLSDKMIDQLRKISPIERKRTDPVYIVNMKLEIVAVVEQKNNVGTWIKKNGYSNKSLGRSTVFEYIRNNWKYKNMFYFVEAKNFDEFIKNIA